LLDGEVDTKFRSMVGGDKGVSDGARIVALKTIRRCKKDEKKGEISPYKREKDPGLFANRGKVEVKGFATALLPHRRVNGGWVM